MIEDDPKLTWLKRRKLRREFARIGREGVRDKLQGGGYGMALRRDAAREWLREREADDEWVKHRTLDAAAIAAIIAIITLLVALGIIK